MASKDTRALATAHYEGASLGCTFRVRELAHASAAIFAARERALSQWWEYSRSAVGQLAGCVDDGCYWCMQPHPDCGRFQAVQDFRFVLGNIELTQRQASRDEHEARFALFTLREQHPHAQQIINDFERDVLGLSVRSPVDATFSPPKQQKRRAHGTTGSTGE